MHFFGRYRTIYIPLLTACAGLILICLLEYLGAFEGVNTYLYDSAFRFRGSRNTSEKIIIAAVDEKTLEKFGRWPIKRAYYAGLFDVMKQASVIGVDLLITEPSDDDLQVAEAAARNGNVIMAVYLNSGLTKVEPVPVLSSLRKGHVHVEEGIDTVVRGMFHTISSQNVVLHSLTSLMHETLTSSTMKREFSPDMRLIQTGGKSVLQTDQMQINYYGGPGTFRLLSVADILEGRYPADYFRDKAVLIGITAPGIVDSVATPFSQDRNRMAGVEVHANIFNNLLDRNAMTEPHELTRWILAAAFSLCLLSLFLRTGERASAIIWGASFVIATALCYSLFSFYNLWIAPSVFYASVSFVFLLSYLIKLDRAAVDLDQKHSSVLKLLGQDSKQKEPAAAGSGIIGFLSPGGINAKIQGLLMVEHQYETKLEETVQKRTEELTRALAMISTMSNEMILRLTKAAESKDEDTGAHIARIGLYAKAVSEELGLSGEFGDLIAFSSAMHDIGKIGIPDRILLKHGSLNPDERIIMNSHTTIGAAILANSDYPKIQMSERIALCHHEHWDGTGYPSGLREEEIPLEARIVTLCDVYDALRSKRPYKEAFDHSSAVRIIRDGDGRCLPGHLDPKLLAIFINIETVFDNIFTTYQDR